MVLFLERAGGAGKKLLISDNRLMATSGFFLEDKNLICHVKDRTHRYRC
jgi:hypothetical protein